MLNVWQIEGSLNSYSLFLKQANASEGVGENAGSDEGRREPWVGEAVSVKMMRLASDHAQI